MPAVRSHGSARRIRWRVTLRFVAWLGLFTTLAGVNPTEWWVCPSVLGLAAGLVWSAWPALAGGTVPRACPDCGGPIAPAGYSSAGYEVRRCPACEVLWDVEVPQPGDDRA